jgi:hypothetical protein
LGGGEGSWRGSRLTSILKGAKVSQNIADKADAAEARTQDARAFMQQVRVAARRKYTPEEKVCMVLEGFCREVGGEGPLPA